MVAWRGHRVVVAMVDYSVLAMVVYSAVELGYSMVDMWEVW